MTRRGELRRWPPGAWFVIHVDAYPLGRVVCCQHLFAVRLAAVPIVVMPALQRSTVATGTDASGVQLVLEFAVFREPESALTLEAAGRCPSVPAAVIAGSLAFGWPDAARIEIVGGRQRARFVRRRAPARSAGLLITTVFHRHQKGSLTLTPSFVSAWFRAASSRW